MLQANILPRAIDRMEPIIRAGEDALPSITIAVDNNPLTIMLFVAPHDMQSAFDRARDIMIYKKARTFLLTGHMIEPEGLYAALYAPGGAVGLFRAIKRGRGVTFGADEQLPPESLDPMAWLRPTDADRLDPQTSAKIKSILDLHAEQAAGTPLVIRQALS